MSSTFSAFSTKTAVVKASFCPFLHVISVPRKGFKPFFTLHILATGLLFAAIYPAFWCFLPCILVHFALRFGAFYPAFWCILPQIMLQKACCAAQDVYLNNVQWLFIHLYAHPVSPQISWCNTRKNVGEGRNCHKNRSHNVKFRTQNVTSPCRCFRQHHITLQ